MVESWTKLESYSDMTILYLLVIVHHVFQLDRTLLLVAWDSVGSQISFKGLNWCFGNDSLV